MDGLAVVFVSSSGRRRACTRESILTFVTFSNLSLSSCPSDVVERCPSTPPPPPPPSHVFVVSIHLNMGRVEAVYVLDVPDHQ